VTKRLWNASVAEQLGEGDREAGQDLFVRENLALAEALHLGYGNVRYERLLG
jgi:hypothetical protein